MIRSRTRTRAGGSGGGSSIPFSYDDDTYWWDFTSRIAGDVEETGDDTLARVPEKVRGYHLFQRVKDMQPLAVSGGISFAQTSLRRMQTDIRTGVTNGSNGLYIGVNLEYPSAVQSEILSLSRAASSTASRGRFYISSSRVPVFQFANNDGGTPANVFTGPSITVGQTYTLEMVIQFNPLTVELYYNGVQQTLASGPTGTLNANNPASDTSQICVGNLSATNGTNSTIGPIQHLIFHDNVPTVDMRASQGAWLNSER